MPAPRTAFVFPGLNGCANAREHLPLLALPGFAPRWRRVAAAFGGRPELAVFDAALRAGEELPVTAATWPLRALAVAAMQLAAAQQLEAAGTRADWLCGYSVGDVARCCHAGVFTFGDVVAFAAALPPLPEAPGATLALHAPDGAAAAAARTRCEAAGVRVSTLSPRFLLLGGAHEALERARAACAGSGVRLTAIGACPLHAEQQRPLAAALRAALAGATFAPPRRAIHSTLWGRALRGDDDLRDELTANAAAPFDFAAAVRALHERHGVTRFVDLGPGRHAQRFVRHHGRCVDAVAAVELLADQGAASTSGVTAPARTRQRLAARTLAAPRQRSRAS